MKFRVIDPPFVPSRPSSPDKPLLTLMVAAAAVGAGGALAFALSMFRPVFYSAEQIAQRIGRPMIGTISRQPGLDSRAPQVLNWIAFGVLTLLLGAIFAVVMALHLDVVERAQLAPLLNPLAPVLELISNAGTTLLEQAKRLLGELGG